MRRELNNKDHTRCFVLHDDAGNEYMRVRKSSGRPKDAPGRTWTEVPSLDHGIEASEGRCKVVKRDGLSRDKERAKMQARARFEAEKKCLIDREIEALAMKNADLCERVEQAERDCEKTEHEIDCCETADDLARLTGD